MRHVEAENTARGVLGRQNGAKAGGRGTRVENLGW